VPTNQIDAFFTGSTIEIEDLSATGSSYVGSSLTLDGTGGPVTLDLPGIVLNDITVTDNSGNTFVTTSQLPCFVQGTRILTERGEVPVESLRVGDRAMALLARGLQPIRWIGHRTLDLRTHPRPQQVWPICVAAGAFGEGQPHRALWLSPGHAVFVAPEAGGSRDGVLTQIENLINGATIVQVPHDRITYWHVELAEHDVLLAEGLPAESYLDTGNRTAFGNGGVFAELHPDFLPRHWTETCTPLVMEGPPLASIKARLLARAAALGHAITEDHGLHLLADGVMVSSETDGEVHHFRLSRSATDVHLLSRTWVPAWMEPDSADWRRLGVCVRRLEIDGTDTTLDSLCGLDGWHHVERDGIGAFRWTSGAGRLPPAHMRSAWS